MISDKAIVYINRTFTKQPDMTFTQQPRKQESNMTNISRNPLAATDPLAASSPLAATNSLAPTYQAMQIFKSICVKVSTLILKEII